MVVPASEPDIPRKEMAQGVYALAEDRADQRDPEPEVPTEQIRPGVYSVLEEVEISAAPPRKRRKKRRKQAGSLTPTPRSWRWLSRAPILAGAMVLVIVVTCSAMRLGSADDSDLRQRGNDERATEASAATAKNGWATFAVSVSPNIPKYSGANTDLPKESAKNESASVSSKNVKSETPRGKDSDQALSVSSPNADKAGVVKESGAVPPAPSAVISEGKSSSPTTIPLVKRRRDLSEEDLRKDLRLAPEIPNLEAAVMTRLVSAQKVHYDTYKTIEREPRVLLKARPDLRTLPVRQGRECRLDKKSAVNLAAFSSKLHALVDNAPAEEGDGKHGMPALLQKFLQTEVRGKRPEWLRAEAVPALQQILMQESKPLRWMLVEILGYIQGPEASAALAKRAIYDLASEVRAVAIQALKDRPPEEYRQVLLDGLRYPWAPVADHAAEALAALHDREVVPILVAYLAEPEPNDPLPSAKNHLLVREIVRVSHAANCLMCHPPAGTTADPAAAVVPGLSLIGSRQGPRFGRYGSEVSISLPTQSSFFVRVDTTFFRQDFSIREPVKTPGTTLVSYPRFDYLVRTRKVDSKEAKELKTKSKSQQREAILFALRELTGTDAGGETDAWAKLFPPAKLDDQGHPVKSW
jgi:hypothetical protein